MAAVSVRTFAWKKEVNTMADFMGSGIGLGDAMVLVQRNNGSGNGQWDNPLTK